MKAYPQTLAESWAEFILTPLKLFSGKPLSIGIAFLILAISLGLWFFWLRPAAKSFIKIYHDLAGSLKNIRASSGTNEEKLAKVDELFSGSPLNANWIEFRACIDFSNGDVFSYSDPRAFFSADRSPRNGYVKWSSTLGGVFLTTGLVFTFIGLSAALLNINTSPDQIRGSIENILNVSSAKFITSIAGIICYIAWTITARKQSSAQDNATQLLSAELRQIFTYISPEILLKQQLTAVERQEDLFKSFSNDLAIAIGQQIENSLRVRMDALPSAIADTVGEALRNSIGPISKELSEIGQQIGAAGNQITGGAGDIFSKVWQEGIGSHLGQFGDQMNKVINALDGLPEKVKATESSMGTEIGKAAKEFSETTARLTSSIEATQVNLNSQLNAFSEKIAAIPTILEDASRETVNSINGAITGAITESTYNINNVTRLGANEFSNKVTAIAGSLDRSAEQLKEASLESANHLKNAHAQIEQGVLSGIKSINESAEASSLQFVRSTNNLNEIVEKLGLTLGKTVKLFDDTQDRLSKAGMTVTAASEKLTSAATSLETSASPLSAIIRQLQSSLDALSKAITQLEKTSESTQKATAGLDQTIVKVHDVAAAQAAEFSQLQSSVRETVNELIRGVGQLGAEISKCIDTYDNEIAKSIGSLETAILDVADIVDERKSPKQ